MDYTTLSRTDNKTEICPECGTHKALNAARIDIAEKEKILAEIRKAAQKEYALSCALIPMPENTVPFDVMKQLNS